MTTGRLSDTEWDRVQRTMPIACVDFVPVRRGPSGAIEEVGLILRATPFDHQSMWCHLGGRIHRDETIVDAVARHSHELIGGTLELPSESRPHAVMEWFPGDPGPDVDAAEHGVDPRKHAISVCYAVEATGDLHPAGREAEDFKWVRLDELSSVDTWPGTQTLIDKVVKAADADTSSLADIRRTAYAAVSARALNHNTLVWQTPALALTAEAFLLTIALGPASSPPARLIAAGLNFMLSVLCLQLMAKHRAMAVIDREVMVNLEKALGLPVYHGRPTREQLPGIARWRSGVWWKFGFVVLGLVALGIFVVTLVQLVR
jgi:ADP-ribose pyrophosphatase YjhB (NUDIX family)